jgi:hypothetical protein
LNDPIQPLLVVIIVILRIKTKFKAAGDAMVAYVSAVKEQNNYCTIKFLPSPDKQAI